MVATSQSQQMRQQIQASEVQQRFEMQQQQKQQQNFAGQQQNIQHNNQQVGLWSNQFSLLFYLIVFNQAYLGSVRSKV